MIQIKNFLVITAIWAIGMVAITATRAILEPAPTAAPSSSHTLAQRL